MKNNISVINRTENEFDVTVDNVDGNIQIIIDKKTDITLLNPGNTFKVNNVEYIVLEQFGLHQTAVIRKETLKNDMKFGSNNNWKESDIQKFLNGEYLEGIERDFGKDRIVKHTIDLLSLDGLDDYGTSTDKVSILTIDQYRKYRKLFCDNLNKCWWLATPDSTLSGNGERYVRCVGSDGGVGYDVCDYAGGVRPFFILQS